MADKFYLFDCDKQSQIHIDTSETTIGRDSILQCDDKRISRQHGILKLAPDQPGQVQITSTHTNPIFIRTSESAVVDILTKDLTATLRHGERFALLPDQFWYEVRFQRDDGQDLMVSSSSIAATTTAIRVRTAEEMNNIDPNVETVPSAAPASETSSNESTKRKHEDEPTANEQERNENNADVSRKKAKGPDDEAETPASTSDANPQNVKPDPDAPSVATCSTSSSSSTATTEQPLVACASAVKTEIKTEPADSSSSPGRPSCQYGVRCYRQQSADHRAQFAHPSDADYRRPSFPPAPDDAPHCPYGASCYRRNPQHFRDFQHPDSSEYKAAVMPPPTQPTPNVPIFVPNSQRPTINTANIGRRRRRLVQNMARNLLLASIVAGPNFSDDDDDDFDGDLFDCDSDSDDYLPDEDEDDGDEQDLDTQDLDGDEE